jgi:uncharacterized lipoprotein YmbA
MKHFSSAFFLVISLVPFLWGCSNLRPSVSAPRYFLLAPTHASEHGSTASPNHDSAPSPQSTAPAIAIAPIKLPGYLTKNSLAVRKSPSEIIYLESANWAERMDEGFLRAITADLASQVPDHSILRSTTRNDRADLELHLTLQQFDVDITGEGVLTADWKTVSPANGKTLHSGQYHTSRKGPNPMQNPAGAVDTLNALINDLSRALAKSLQ